MRRQIPLLQHFNWRALLARLLVNAVALAFTALVVPNIYFIGSVGHKFWSLLIVALGIGLINAFIKPLVQVVMLPFIFVSYGLVVVLINSLMLGLADLFFPNRFHVSTIVWALVGGAVFGIVSSLLENLLGLSPPVLEGDPLGRAIDEARAAGGTSARFLAAVTPAGALPARMQPGGAGTLDEVPSEFAEAEPGEVTAPPSVAESAPAEPPPVEPTSAEHSNATPSPPPPATPTEGSEQ
jgi:putative membrane protein